MCSAWGRPRSAGSTLSLTHGRSGRVRRPTSGGMSFALCAVGYPARWRLGLDSRLSSCVAAVRCSVSGAARVARWQTRDGSSSSRLSPRSFVRCCFSLGCTVYACAQTHTYTAVASAHLSLSHTLHAMMRLRTKHDFVHSQDTTHKNSTFHALRSCIYRHKRFFSSRAQKDNQRYR